MKRQLKAGCLTILFYIIPASSLLSTDRFSELFLSIILLSVFSLNMAKKQKTVSFTDNTCVILFQSNAKLKLVRSLAVCEESCGPFSNDGAPESVLLLSLFLTPNS